MQLSILIPTLNEPYNIAKLDRLLKILKPQVNAYLGQVEIQIHEAGKNIPTGTKRNLLINGSEGEYFCFVDDDDIVPEYYVDELMNAISQRPDVVTFEGFMTTNGQRHQNFTIKVGSEYIEKDNHYYGYPNHLCCFRREVVKDIKFQPIWIEEDFRWATEIMQRDLLKTSVYIEKWMYHYDFIEKKYRKSVKARR